MTTTIRQRPPGDPVTAIRETEATGETARLFADIRNLLGVNVVNLIWRHLATLPDCLPWAWAAVRPVYASGLAKAQSEALKGGIVLPGLPPRAGWGFEEVARRHGDFAAAGAAAVVSLRDGCVDGVRIALMGVHETPVRARAAENLLAGSAPDAAAIAAAADAASAAVEPMDDLHGSADYRRHLAGVLTRRVLDAAVLRAAA